MQDKTLRWRYTFLARQVSITVSLLARLAIGALWSLMKIHRAIGCGDVPLAAAKRFENANLCEILKRSGGCNEKEEPRPEDVDRDLLEKNEYLRTVNEEVIKLTKSLETANAELEETRDYLDNLIQNSADMIVSTGYGRIITLFNRRAEEILGYKSDEVVGRPIDILYQEGEVERVEKHLRQNPDGRLMEHEIRLRTKAGLEIPARLTASLLYDRGGKVVGSVGACADLTEVKALEHELMKQQKLLAIAELGGAASHELNQPLTVAMGRIQLIFRRDGEDCLHRHDLLAIERELERIADMVRRMGKITRYKTKPYVGESRIIDLD